MLKLFYAPGTCSLASHIALEEAGADYVAQLVDFSAEEQRSSTYLATNPKGRVPALETPRGILTETPAILAYIAQTHPNANLAPIDDAYAFAEMQAFNSYLCSTVHVAHAHKMRGHRWSDDADAIASMTAKVQQNMTDCFRLIEDEMVKGPWVMGDTYSVADAYLFTVSRWLKGDGVDIAQFDGVADHFKRMSDRAAVENVLAAVRPT